MDLSVSHKDWNGKARVAVCVSFAYGDCQNVLIVRRDAFRPLDGRDEKVTDKQFERLCKGIRAGTRSGMILENSQKRPMPSVARVEVFRVGYEKKTTSCSLLKPPWSGR